MTVHSGIEKNGKLEEVLAAVETVSRDALLTTFTHALLDDVDSSELTAYSADELSRIAAQAFAHMQHRVSGAPAIAIREAQTQKAGFTVVDIVNDDMPFLLDSILGVLRDELDLMPELVAHPIFQVERAPSGDLIDLRAVGEEKNGRRESCIHMHFRRLASDEIRNRIEPAILSVLRDVRHVVTDFRLMTERLQRAIADYKRNPPPAGQDGDVSESIAFLEWIERRNFTFLGLREYRFDGDEVAGELSPVAGSDLGLLRNPELSVLRRGGPDRRLTPDGRTFFLNSPPVVVAKANARSTVHRRVHMDTVSIKLYGADGRINGELRIAGLFTASAYNASTRNIPLLSRKIDQVMEQSGHSDYSHSGRALLNVLETFPRDELFQIPVEQLTRISEEVLKIELTPRPRVFIHRDVFKRFISAFIYVPRGRYDSSVRSEIVSLLEREFGGKFDAFTPFFTEGTTVRLHIIIWRKEEEELKDTGEATLERGVEKIVRTWRDEFADRLVQHYGDAAFPLLAKYRDAFPIGYEESNRPGRAMEDIQRLEKLNPERPADIDLFRRERAKARDMRATLQQLDTPIALSKRVPILENLGFNVISESTYRITPKVGGEERVIFLHDSALETANGEEIDIYEHEDELESGFLAVWHGRAANDRFNGLIMRAKLHWREVALLRAFSAYLRQTGAPFGAVYVAQALNKHPGIAVDLISLFRTLFDPSLALDAAAREERHAALTAQIAQKLDAIPVLDEDRILRHFLAMIEATLRTNFYQKTPDGGFPHTIAFKLRSAEIDWLPAPKPFAEIFVYSTRFEGVHLRGGPIARGGLRWSDRPQDFRTEILSLAKAQQVKNTVIIPQGAKGGFVPRKTLNGVSREEMQREGVACYQDFISALLSITDNLIQGRIVPPEDTVRRDGDDPYLVVAADKGTAAFSDIANDISLKHGFWLGDAFASGGSAGYDHKKMGITARGAWEAVKRHFREMNIDIQTQPFTVAGVGDMSGDVFGNGTLLSKAIKLVAAFDHRDIFIDPAPDPATSWEERRRMFNLPRSTWQDYDRSLLSQGGGIYPRSAKSINLSPEAQALLKLGPQVTPQEVISAILKAEVDLLWFGGIGTYVRASTETDAQAGDRANDAIRVTAAQLRAKAVGEGANLAMTQHARVEYALDGGRVNTDAIDNSAGVNSSDYEVNIKIAFGGAMGAGRITLDERNQLLVAMTDEVAAAVLRNNYLQTLALSLGEMRGLSDLGFQQHLMRRLEADGRLDRTLEGLPSDAALAERRKAGLPLTRPELAVLLAYSKIDLTAGLVNSTVPDDPYLGRELFDYFPATMRQRFAGEIANHALRREIIATVLANDIINRGGSTFILRLEEETGHTPVDIAYASAATKAVYGLESLYDAIDALDGRIDGRRQLELYREIQNLLRRQTAWFLRHGDFSQGLEPEIARYKAGIDYLTMNMADVLPEKAQLDLRGEEAALRAEGVPDDVATRLAALAPLAQALDIVMVANQSGPEIAMAARTLFVIRDEFHLHALTEGSESLGEGDYFDRLAVNSTLSAVSAAQRAIAKAIAAKSDFAPTFEAWRAQHGDSVKRVSGGISDILEGGNLTLAKLTVAVAQLRDLAKI